MLKAKQNTLRAIWNKFMDQHGLTYYCLVALQHKRNTTRIPQQADTVVAFGIDVFVIVFYGHVYGILEMCHISFNSKCICIQFTFKAKPTE